MVDSLKNPIVYTSKTSAHSHLPTIETELTFVQSREHHLDAVRAFLMLVGIPFHATHPFRQGLEFDWPLKSVDYSPTLMIIMEILHLFRMHAFFVIAGYFSAMLLVRRDPRTYLISRAKRLLPPLAVGLFLIVPFMNLVASVYSLGVDGGLRVWVGILAKVDQTSVAHLWFVVVLIYYTLTAALACSIFPTLRKGVITRKFADYSSVYYIILLAFAFFMFFYGYPVYRVLSYVPRYLVDTFSFTQAAQYLPYFTLGFLLQRYPAFSERFNRPSIFIALSAFILTAAFVWQNPRPSHFALALIQPFASLALTQSILSYAGAFIKRPSKFIRRLVDMSFTIYLVHLPVLFSVFSLVEYLEIGPVTKFFVLTSLTGIFSVIISTAILRSPQLYFWFGGPPVAKTTKAM